MNLSCFMMLYSLVNSTRLSMTLLFSHLGTCNWLEFIYVLEVKPLYTLTNTSVTLICRYRGSTWT